MYERLRLILFLKVEGRFVKNLFKVFFFWGGGGLEISKKIATTNEGPVSTFPAE